MLTRKEIAANVNTILMDILDINQAVRIRSLIGEIINSHGEAIGEIERLEEEVKRLKGEKEKFALHTKKVIDRVIDILESESVCIVGLSPGGK